MTAQDIKILAHGILCAAGIIQKDIHQIVKPLYRFRKRFCLLHTDIGFHLSDNAAHIFTAIHIAIIVTEENLPGLPAHDTADVITVVLVTDNALVIAVDQKPFGITRDTADIRSADQLLFLYIFQQPFQP